MAEFCVLRVHNQAVINIVIMTEGIVLNDFMDEYAWVVLTYTRTNLNQIFLHNRERLFKSGS